MTCPRCAGLGPAMLAPFQGPPGRDGRDGAPGSQGGDGPPGLPGDYGYIRYGEMMGAAPRMLSPFVESPFVVMAPRVVADNLKAPFAGFVFLDTGNVLRARKTGDSYLLAVRLSAVPSIIGGWMRISAYVAGNISGLAGPVASRTVPLVGAAGDTTRIDEQIQVFPATGFIANGAVINLYSSVPVTLSNDVLFVTPQVAAA